MCSSDLVDDRAAVEVFQLIEAEKFIEERTRSITRTVVIQQTLGFFSEALRRRQSTLARGLQQGIIGSGAPTEIGETGCNLPIIQLAKFSLSGPLLFPVEEIGRLQEGRWS